VRPVLAPIVAVAKENMVVAVAKRDMVAAEADMAAAEAGEGADVGERKHYGQNPAFKYVIMFFYWSRVI
jgi:hypothetical protein